MSNVSAIVVNFFKSFVLLLQLITVAQAFIKRAVVGFQTILLLQITQTIFHSTSNFSCFKISIIQAGVQGTNQVSSQIRTFH